MMNNRNDIKEYDYLYKIKVIGPVNSGKSTLINKAKDFHLSSSSYFSVKMINANNKKIKFHIWEQNSYKFPHRDTNLKGVHAILVAVDMTNKNALEDLRHDIMDIERFACENVITLVVGTKLGDENRVIKPWDLLDFLQPNLYYVTAVNSLSGYNLEALFINCGELLANKFDNEENNRKIYDITNKSISKKLLSAIGSFDFVTRHYRYLTFLLGANQSQSNVRLLTADILQQILILLTPWQNKLLFSNLLFGKMAQIQTMRFVNSYNKSIGFKSEESQSFVSELKLLCDEKLCATTKLDINKQITIFAEKKTKQNTENCRAMVLLSQHGLYKKENTNNKPAIEVKENNNCSIQ